MDWTSIIVAAITAGGVGGAAALGKLIVDLRRAPIEASRTDAEAENLAAQAMASITAAGAALVDPLTGQINRQAAEIERLSQRLAAAEEKADRLDDEIRELRRDRESLRETLSTHAAWDWNVMAMLDRLRDSGIDIPPIDPAPPLNLPHH